MLLNVHNTPIMTINFYSCILMVRCKASKIRASTGTPAHKGVVLPLVFVSKVFMPKIVSSPDNLTRKL